MAYSFTDSRLGMQPLTSTDTVQNLPVGTVVEGRDPIYGEGKFIYLRGVASTAVGSMVVYDTTTGTTASTLTTTTTRGPVAVSLSANVAGQYGWYQISGMAVTVNTAAAANALVYGSATGGSSTNSTTATAKVDGAVFRSATAVPSSGFALVQLDSPAMNGNG